jgi:hypothetical protein
MEFMECFTLAVMVIGAFIGAIVVWRISRHNYSATTTALAV